MGICLVILYADNDMIRARGSEWLQNALSVLSASSGGTGSSQTSQLLYDDFPIRSTTVGHVGGGGGSAMHVFGGFIPLTTTEMDPMLVMWHGTYQ